MIKKIVSSLSLFILVFFNVFGYTDLNQFLNEKLPWQLIWIPFTIKLTDYSKYDDYNHVKIVANDGLNETTVFNKDVYFNKYGEANILVLIDPSQFNIDTNILFKIYINGNISWQIKSFVLGIKWLFSDDTNMLITDSWKIYTIENFLTKKYLDDNYQKLLDKINKYKKWLLSKFEIQNYIMLKDWKIDYKLLPFSMNNLACNIKEKDLQRIEKKLWIHIDRTKIVYDLPCKDWMTDLHSLITIIKAYNQDPNLLDNYK